MNIQPVQPLASPNSGLGSIISNDRRSLNSPVAKVRNVFDNLDVNKIGSGRLMIEGSYYKRLGEKTNFGLKGQLMGVKTMGRRTTTKNLSFDNLKQIHNLIADRLKNKAVGSKIMISRRDKINIMKESRKMVKAEGSHFSWQDRDDLKKVVDTIRKQTKDNLFHRDGAAVVPADTNRQAVSADQLLSGGSSAVGRDESALSHQPIRNFE